MIICRAQNQLYFQRYSVLERYKEKSIWKLKSSLEKWMCKLCISNTHFKNLVFLVLLMQFLINWGQLLLLFHTTHDPHITAEFFTRLFPNFALKINLPILARFSFFQHVWTFTEVLFLGIAQDRMHRTYDSTKLNWAHVLLYSNSTQKEIFWKQWKNDCAS